MKEVQEKKKSEKACEMIFREMLIDAFPIVKLKYQKYKSLREEGKQERDAEKIKAKLE